MLSNLREVPTIQARRFFSQDPGGCSLQVQGFLKIKLRLIFGTGSLRAGLSLR